MKYIGGSLIVLMVIIQLGCSSSNNATSTQAVHPNDIPYTSLIDMLRKEPQLTISGPDSNPTIRIRGSRTIEGNNEPLFELDGVILGNGYSSARSVDVNDVASIRVLPASQAGLYGSRGANGVIKIQSK